MNVKKIAVTTMTAGAMGAAALGLGAGLAQADHDDWVPPGIPDVDFTVPPGDVGQLTQIPPGQLKKLPVSPVYGVPPGHWDDAIDPVIVVPRLPDVLPSVSIGR